MLRIQDIMTTDVVTVTPTTTLRDAAELFARRHVGGAPVVDGRRLVGVVSVSDILDFVAAACAGNDIRVDAPTGPPVDHATDARSSNDTSFFADRWSCTEAETVGLLGAADGGGSGTLDGHTVSDVMTAEILALSPGTELAIAAERMRIADVHRLLVVEQGSLVGILSTTDLARAVVADRSPRTGRAISIRRCTTSIPLS